MWSHVSHNSRPLHPSSMKIHGSGALMGCSELTQNFTDRLNPTFRLFLRVRKNLKKNVININQTWYRPTNQSTCWNFEWYRYLIENCNLTNISFCIMNKRWLTKIHQIEWQKITPHQDLTQASPSSVSCNSDTCFEL